jgi:putative SOS response-associated peptidase YedK
MSRTNETGKPVRWRIGMESGEPLAIAGLWRAWKDEEGESLSFTMLTVNASEHPLTKRFHMPGDEKRSVVIVPPDAYDDWLACRSTDEARSFLGLFPVDGFAHVDQFTADIRTNIGCDPHRLSPSCPSTKRTMRSA